MDKLLRRRNSISTAPAELLNHELESPFYLLLRDNAASTFSSSHLANRTLSRSTHLVTCPANANTNSVNKAYQTPHTSQYGNVSA